MLLALPPEPRPKARNLPTRSGARDVGAQANRIRLQGQHSWRRQLTEWLREHTRPDDRGSAASSGDISAHWPRKAPRRLSL